MTLRPRNLLFPMVLLSLGSLACGRVLSKMAYQDGNKLYKEENYKRAIEKYDAALGHDPNMIEAYFYRGSSHQSAI